MNRHIVSSESLEIAHESDIIRVRRQARTLAQARGFDAFATAALTTAASELARNVWTHAGGGAVTLEEVTDGTRTGICMTFRDNGPGIADVDRVLAGGFSTAGSLGLGVSGTRRLVDEFMLETTVNQGTSVTAVKWKRY